MMAGHARGDGGAITGINVTPLVDITLVLLIIFIVTARIVATPAVPMDLPAATTSETVQVVFSVVLPQAGPVSVNGQPVSGDAELARLAKDELAKTPDLRAVISASGAVPHRLVIHTLDVLRAVGLKHIAFGTLLEDPGR
jgi:biopolymer transport protein TolR